LCKKIKIDFKKIKMKKITFTSLSVLLLMVLLINFSCENKKETETVNHIFVAEDISSYPAYAKFGMKSGKVTMKTSAMGMKQDMIQYFDDWGTMTAVEIKMSMLGNTTNLKVVLKDGASWEYDVDSRKGVKRIIDTLAYDNINFLQLTEDKFSELNVVFMGTEECLNRKCNKFKIVDDNSGMEAILYVWKGIVLKSDAKMMGINVKLDVIEIEEDYQISHDIFLIPEDVEFEVVEGML